MKIVFCFAICLICALTLKSNAAEVSKLAVNAEKAAKSLPRGAIVIAEQTGDDAPIISVAGKQEPMGVPPEKVIFEIGSISKVFTGILLAQAVLEKRVTLDTTLRDLMGPGRSFADPNVAAITLQQLATHTSGLPRIPDNLIDGADPQDPYAHYDRALLDACIARAKLAHAPPFPSSYSNLGVGLLGDLLSRVYGKTWEELVLERIAQPLGLSDTCVTLTPEQMKRLAPPYAGDQPTKPWHCRALAGAGALRSTPADMLKFAQALRRPESTPLRAAIEMIEQPRDGQNLGLCLQILRIKDRNSYWFAGGTGGFRSWFLANPTSARVVVILINNNALAPESILSGKVEMEVDPARTKTPPDPSLAVFAGSYDTGAKAGDRTIFYVFEARGSDLWMQITGQQFVPLTRHPTAKDRFEFKPVRAEVQFTREQGEVVATTLYQDGLEIRATKLGGQGRNP